VNGTQCDNCRRFSPDSADWLFLSRTRLTTGLFTFGPQQEVIACFCSVSCLADYSYARAIAEEKPKEPADG